MTNEGAEQHGTDMPWRPSRLVAGDGSVADAARKLRAWPRWRRIGPRALMAAGCAVAVLGLVMANAGDGRSSGGEAAVAPESAPGTTAAGDTGGDAAVDDQTPPSAFVAVTTSTAPSTTAPSTTAPSTTASSTTAASAAPAASPEPSNPQPAVSQPAVSQPSASEAGTASTTPQAVAASPTGATTSTVPPSTDPVPVAGSPAAVASTSVPPVISASPAAPAPAAPAAPVGSPAVVSGSYQTNLALVHAQTVRNRNEDDSPFLDTPSALLDPEDHYGPRSDYLNNPAGNPEQAFPVEEGGQFRIACEFSHFAYDDPLVFPGQPGASHLHTFFGNTDTNAFSTADSILNTGGGTCNGQELNRTAYWVPALFDSNGNVRIPERLVVYYKGEGLANGRAEPYPTGAAMIAKVDLNTVDNGRGGAVGKFSFVCSDNYSSNGGESANTMVGCDGSFFQTLFGASDPHMVLEMNVKFPQCWNGRDPSNPANYAAPTEGGWYFSNCTGEFNRTLTNLEYFVDYPVEPGENTADWYLSSDVDPATKALKPGPRGSTIHADWMSGWHAATNKAWIDNCVNLRLSEPSGCGFGYLTNGGPDGNNPLPGPALKYRDQFTGPFKVPAAQIHRDLCPGGGDPASATAAAYCRPAAVVAPASLAGGGTSVFCPVTSALSRRGRT